MKPIKADTGEGPQSVTSILSLIGTRRSVEICSRKIAVLLLDLEAHITVLA